MPEVHRGEREGDRAQPVGQGHDEGPRLAHRRPEEAQEQEHDQDGRDAADEEGQGPDGRPLVRRPGARGVVHRRQHEVGRDAEERGTGRLVRVVVPGVEGVVAGVALEPVDAGGAVLHQGPDQVVPAVLVPGGQLLEEAVAEQQRQGQDDLAPGRCAQARPPTRRHGRRPSRSRSEPVPEVRSRRGVGSERVADVRLRHRRQCRTSVRGEVARPSHRLDRTVEETDAGRSTGRRQRNRPASPCLRTGARRRRARPGPSSVAGAPIVGYPQAR